jgi:hypothetical protein
MTNTEMDTLIRAYFAACNAGDAAAIATYFEPDAVHYFPPGMYGGAFRGATTIGERWKNAVASIGSYWTIDRLLCDAPSRQAVLEWTHFKRKQNTILRGDEWYIFSERGLIAEIRAYYASPQDPTRERLELDGFDYLGRGYPEKAPVL